ncbi:MAG: TIGR03088 family PEP-CTERM/XrtA system glycosyltransferase [Methylohalobius sp.]|nr:TIGR03088 family PEP-CTERM/XrtA system glycosyltransferase [Methylohalobius sp.]
MPLIVHVIYRLGMGGLENGLINLIHHLPEEKYRHAIICLTEATEFKQRLRRAVPIYELHKREGHDFGLYLRVWRLFRELKPDIVHTRNLAALECQLPAWLAGVPVRIHSEHGWDVFDPDGTNRKYLWFRRFFCPLIHQYVALSRQLEDYLIEQVKVPAAKVVRICNGVDTDLFHPPAGDREPIPGCPFTDQELILIGTVGRMHGVKDQPTLARAFIALLKKWPELKAKVRLILVGDGPLRAECQGLLAQAGLLELAWLPGERDDIPQVLRGLDIFVLPSQAEGISNTILEAMATGLPVIATKVGGNWELVHEGVNGTLVPSKAPDTLAKALTEYVQNSNLRHAHGQAARQRAKIHFSLASMGMAYEETYDQLLLKRSRCAASSV